MSAYIVEDDVLEGVDAWNDGEVVLPSDSADDGVLITTSDVSGSISFAIFEQGSDTAVYSTTLSSSSVIVNVPVAWRLDSIGRNFRHRVAIATVGALKGGKRYTMIYSIPTTSFGTVKLVYVWRIVPLEV